MGEKSMWKRLIAEFIGTFMFVLVGAGAVAYFSSTTEFTLLSALAFGGIMVVIGYLFGPFSGGHINPAISLGVALVGRMAWAEMILYWIAQLLGGLLAAFLVYWIFGTDSNAGASLGTLTFSSAWKAVAVETTITALIVFTFLVISKNWKLSLISGLVLGAVIAVTFIFAGRLTGASGNPARSFGPAAVSGNLKTIWIYLLGPLLGAVIASILYSIMFYSAYTPVVQECGTILKNDCNETILQREFQAVDNCGKKIYDDAGIPVMFKKYKIDTSKGSYRFGVKRNKDKIKYGYDKEAGKFAMHALSGISAESLANVGPEQTALFKLPISKAVDHVSLHHHGKHELIESDYLVQESDKKKVENFEIQIFEVQEKPQEVRAPQKVEVQKAQVPQKVQEVRVQEVRAPQKVEVQAQKPQEVRAQEVPQNNSMIKQPKDSKLSQLILNGMAAKTPFSSPTSLSRAMSGIGTQF